MNIFVTTIFCCYTLVFGDEEKYTTKYDHINFDEIIQSERLLKNYVNCLLDKGNCTPYGQELKRVLPDALQTDCRKCSDAQKNGIDKVIRYMVKNKRDWWNELEDRFDTQREYIKRYKEEWKKKGFTFDE